MAEPDPLLRRIERNSVIACGLIAAGGWIVARGALDVPLGVFGGGALAAISYRGIKGGIDTISRAAAGKPGRTGTAIGLVKFFTRYGILTAAAYVIMARLALPPVAVIAGASSIVAAVAMEAFRPRRGVSR